MTDSSEDSVTKLNTQLNKSMVLMEDAVDAPSQSQKRKSITINTKSQPPSATSSPMVKARKSILKKSDKLLNDSTHNKGVNEEESNVIPQQAVSAVIPLRPHTVRNL